MFYVEIFWKDKMTGIVEVDGMKMLRKECYLPEDTKYPFMYFPFYYYEDGYRVCKWLESRVVTRDRDGLEELLRNSGFEKYDALEILKKYHGVSSDDYLWLNIDDGSGFPKATYEDIKAMGVRA